MKVFIAETTFSMPYLPGNTTTELADPIWAQVRKVLKLNSLLLLFPVLSRFLSPLNMLIGGTVVVLVFLGFVWMSHNKDILRKLKKQYPTTFVVAIMLSSYFLISYLGDVMVFMFGITLPLLCRCLFFSLGG